MTLTKAGQGLALLEARVLPSGRVAHDFTGGVRRSDPGTWEADMLLRYDGRPAWPIHTRVDLRRGHLYWKVLQEIKVRDWLLRVRAPAAQVQRAVAEVDAWRVENADGPRVLCAETWAPAWLLDEIPWSELVRPQTNRDCPWAIQRMELLKISIPHRQLGGSWPEPASAAAAR